MNKTQQAEYVLLSHYPAKNRTEHVHYGILTRSPQGWRAHVMISTRKLRAIDPRISSDALRDLEGSLPELLRDCNDWEQARQTLRAFGIHASEGKPGVISFTDKQDYANGVRAAMRNQVYPPRADETDATTEHDLCDASLGHQP